MKILAEIFAITTARYLFDPIGRPPPRLAMILVGNRAEAVQSFKFLPATAQRWVNALRIDRFWSESPSLRYDSADFFSKVHRFVTNYPIFARKLVNSLRIAGLWSESPSLRHESAGFFSKVAQFVTNCRIIFQKPVNSQRITPDFSQK